MTDFLLFLLYLATLVVAIPMIVFLSTKLGVIGYHVGTREAAKTLRRMEQSDARQGR